jgi:uncharacterized protein
MNNLTNDKNLNFIRETLTLILLSLGCAIAVNLTMFLIATAMGVDLKAMLNELNENSSIEERNAVRSMFLLSTAGTFLLPALLFARKFYRSSAKSYLTLDKTPDAINIFLGFAILLVSLPFIQYILVWNKSLPLPDLLRSAEKDTETMLKGLLKAEKTYEIFFNVIVVGLLPALSEELFFRGVLQQSLVKRLGKHYHAAIWLTGIIFSAIHFQFEGFLPRMILGAVLGYIFYYTKNIWVPIAAHFIYNASQVVAYPFLKENGMEATLEKTAVPMTAAGISVIMSILLLFLLQFRNIEKNKT